MRVLNNMGLYESMIVAYTHGSNSNFQRGGTHDSRVSRTYSQQGCSSTMDKALLPLPYTMAMKKKDDEPQGAGSSFTVAVRTCVCCLLHRTEKNLICSLGLYIPLTISHLACHSSCSQPSPRRSSYRRSTTGSHRRGPPWAVPNVLAQAAAARGEQPN